MAIVGIPGIPQGVEPGKVLINLIVDRRNFLLRRRELIFEVWHVGIPTPDRGRIRKELSSMLGLDEGLVFVERILTDYGLGRSVVEVHVYDDRESAEAIEPLYMKLRNMPKEEARKIWEEIRKKKKGSKK
jgi:small subunit ribosomal protein S24e